MIAYLLKSATCLALLLVFHYLVLEREKMHNFNRFYLLGSVFFSFLAPLYIIYMDATPIIFEAAENTSAFPPTEIGTTEIIPEKPFNYIYTLIGIYSLISFILLFRFGKNLFNIIQKTRNNSKIKYQKAVLVLVDDKILPHTFWNFIFINKKEYEEKKIEQELFTHELTHVTQKHTLDILILEFIQCLFWINPFIILLKKSVQLNHEFLADETVINEHKNIFQYQHLLLNKASWNNKYYLASNLNYSLTKKRLKMMTTQSSQTKIWIKKLAVIPLLAGFMFLFGERIEAQYIKDSIEEEIETIYEQKKVLETIEEQIFSSKGEKINTGFIDLNGTKHYFVTINNSTKYYNRKGQLANKAGIIISNLKTNASDVIPDNYVKRTFYNGKVFCEFFDNIPNNNKRKKEIKKLEEIEEIEEIVESLDNISTINYIKKYKDNDVLYYYNGKSIKHKKALNLINNNRPIDMLTRYVDGKMVINLNKKNQKKERRNLPVKNNDKEFKEIIEKIVSQYDQSSYQELNNIYESKRKEKPHFIESSEERQTELIRLFSELGSLYFKFSKENKKKVKRPIHPHDPYLRLMKNNKVFYKSRKDLTEEDKLLIPPPPPVPNASKEEILKAKKAYDAWKERTGNDFAVPPPPPPKKSKKEINKQQGAKNIEEIANLNKKDNYFTNKLNNLTQKDKSKKSNQSNNDFLKIAQKSGNIIYIAEISDTIYSISKLKGGENTESTKDKKYFLDGKAITYSELIKIDSQEIKSVNVFSKNIYVVSKTIIGTKKVLNKSKKQLPFKFFPKSK
tara:strand:- start:5899 stop:8274 length:2376 start_codon:yes stop_codon:yes gene_type:complete